MKKVLKATALALLIAVFTAVSFAVFSASAEAAIAVSPSDIVPGDVNGDGKVNLSDLLRMKKYIVDDTTDIVLNKTDIDNADGVGAQDLSLLAKILFGKDVFLTDVPVTTDTRWYNSTETSFTIYTPSELFGFAYLVNSGSESSNRFNGKTVSMGRDIDLNYGWDAKAATVSAPANVWIPVGKNSTYQGTFDGKGHSISGLYVSGSTQMLGMFAQANQLSTIKNFKLLNSYINSTYTANDGDRAFAGSIAGYTKGTVDSVYSDAVVLGRHSGVGGLIGSITDTQTHNITGCEFAGTITLSNTTGRRAGGLIGTIYGGGTTNISHCLFSGTLSLPHLESGTQSGGIVGRIDSSTVNISDTLSSGNIYTYDNTQNLGSIVGYQQGSGAASVLNLTDVYARSGYTCTSTSTTKTTAIGTPEGTVNGSAVVNADILGTDGYMNTTLDFRYGKYWVAVNGDEPVLAAFHTENIAPITGLMRIDTSWFNTTDLTFTINNAEELYGFAYLVNNASGTSEYASRFGGRTVKLGSDITVNDSSWNAKAQNVTVPEFSWTPIAASKSFLGKFDGQGHTISGLYQVFSGSYGGLFGEVSGDAQGISNFKIKNSYFKDTKANELNLIGSAAAFTGASVSGVYSDAVVIANGYYAGGIVGAAKGGANISDCWYDGKLTSTGMYGRFAGGILGSTYTAGSNTVDNCLFTGTIACDNAAQSPQLGGIVGAAGNISNCASNLTISNSLNAGTLTMTGSTNNVGSVLGAIRSGSTAAVDNVYVTNECYNKKCVFGNDTLDAAVKKYAKNDLIGIKAFVNNVELDFTSTGHWALIEGKTPELRALTEETPIVVDEAIQADTSWYNDNDSEFVIDTPEELFGLAYLVNTTGKQFENKTVKLGADISVTPDYWDANAETVTAPLNPWTTIGYGRSFKGTFDGQGHTISGLYEVAGRSYVGLFGEVSAASGGIRNFRLVNSYFENNKSFNMALTGGVAGFSAAPIENVYCDANIKCIGYYAGGIVGAMNGGCRISGCQFDGTLTCTGDMARFVGGIAGAAYKNASQITNCLFTGTLNTYNTANSPQAGGIVGSAGNINNDAATLTVTDCLSAGRVVVLTGGSGNNVASVIGNVRAGSTAAFTDVYATVECYMNKTTFVGVPVASGVTVSGGVTLVYSDDIKNQGGSKNLTGLDFESVWTDTVGGAPSLRALADPGDVLDIALLDSAVKLFDGGLSAASMVQSGNGAFGYNTACDLSSYNSYVSALQNGGYTLAADNSIDNGAMLNSTFSKGKLSLSVSFDGAKIYISGIYCKGLSPYLNAGYEADTLTANTAGNTTLHMYELNTKGNCFIVQLKNGHFVLNDVGDAGNLQGIFSYLKTLAGTNASGEQNPVIIDAIFITHTHTDHIGALADKLSAEALKDVYIEGVYLNAVSTDVCGIDANAGHLKYVCDNLYSAVSVFNKSNGDATELYRVEAGQKYYFDDISVDVLVTPDQFVKADFTSFNDTSVWYCLGIEGKKVLIAGDADEGRIAYAAETYSANVLKADVLAAFHHGQNMFADSAAVFAVGNTSGQILLVPCPDGAEFAENYATANAVISYNFNSENVYFDDANTVLTFNGVNISVTK